jgi:hypothetical protein
MTLPEIEIDETVEFDEIPDKTKSDGVEELSVTVSDIINAILVEEVVDAEDTVGGSLGAADTEAE